MYSLTSDTIRYRSHPTDRPLIETCANHSHTIEFPSSGRKAGFGVHIKEETEESK